MPNPRQELQWSAGYQRPLQPFGNDATNHESNHKQPIDKLTPDAKQPVDTHCDEKPVKESIPTRDLKRWTYSSASLSVCMLFLGCSSEPLPSEVVSHSAAAARSTDVSEAAVTTFCGDCHAVPPVTSFPRQAWRKEVEQGYAFYHELSRKDLPIPNQEGVVAYFERLSPEQLDVPVPHNLPGLGHTSLQFRQQHSDTPKIELPAVSHIKWIPGSEGRLGFLVFCDMRSGEVRTWAPKTKADTQLRATLANPAHMEPCDLDQDGKQDYVVAELASLRSEDHRRGAVVWLRPQDEMQDPSNPQHESWDISFLASNLGRVADAQPFDADLDGDLDILVGEFGHFRTGGICLLENVGMNEGKPTFKKHGLDDRHGTIQIIPWRLPGSAKPGFVALISQEYEVVEFFRQATNLTFSREGVFAACDPAFGSSGMQATDMDQDGDLDLLYSNGDTFGSAYIKPYHGIHWLENRGVFPFVQHRLTDMIGVQRALAADLDDDGDQDVIAVGLMPENLRANEQIPRHDSIVLLEQQAPGKFVRFSLERGNFVHAAIDVADMDGDGDLDLSVGNLQGLSGEPLPWLTIWWNLKFD